MVFDCNQFKLPMKKLLKYTFTYDCHSIIILVWNLYIYNSTTCTIISTNIYEYDMSY